MNWCKCPKCNHKLFMFNDDEQNSKHVEINIKCSSCKEIINLIIDKGVPYYERKD